MLSLRCCLLVYTIIIVLKPSMDLRLLPIVGFLLSFGLILTSATITMEDYWKSKLPNTPMPKQIRDFLPSDSIDLRKWKAMDGTTVNFFTRQWAKSALEGQLRDDPNALLFFREKDLLPGTTTKRLKFGTTTTKETFLPRQEADAIPFSSNKLSDVLQRFSIVPGSNEEQVMKNTIQECEDPAILEKYKYCATSLESMVDFSISKLGTNVQIASTEVDKEESQKQKYTFKRGIQKLGNNDALVCHSQPYVYAVFYCHATRSTKAYKIPLVGADGTKVNAIAVCHTDTEKWSPNALAFQFLKVKPGTTVCHFLTKNQVVWFRN